MALKVITRSREDQHAVRPQAYSVYVASVV